MGSEIMNAVTIYEINGMKYNGPRTINFFFQAEDGIRDVAVTGVQTCALPIFPSAAQRRRIVRQRLPEVVDPIGLAGGHDVVIDGAHFGGGVGVFNQSKGSHADQDSAWYGRSEERRVGKEWRVGCAAGPGSKEV